MDLLFHDKNMVLSVEAWIASSLCLFRCECIREEGRVPVKITDVEDLVPLYYWLLENTCGLVCVMLLQFDSNRFDSLSCGCERTDQQTNRQRDRETERQIPSSFLWSSLCRFSGLVPYSRVWNSEWTDWISSRDALRPRILCSHTQM